MLAFYIVIQLWTFNCQNLVFLQYFRVKYKGLHFILKSNFETTQFLTSSSFIILFDFPLKNLLSKINQKILHEISSCLGYFVCNFTSDLFYPASKLDPNYISSVHHVYSCRVSSLRVTSLLLPPLGQHKSLTSHCLFIISRGRP